MKNEKEELVSSIAHKVINSDREMLVLKYHYMTRAFYALIPTEMDNASGLDYGTDGANYFYDKSKLLTDYLADDIDTGSIYLHSVIHCLYMHPFFADKHDIWEIWNLSCDIFVWYIMCALDKESVSQDIMIQIDLIKKHVKVFTAQSIYRYLTGLVKGRIEEDKMFVSMIETFKVDDHSFWYPENRDKKDNKNDSNNDGKDSEGNNERNSENNSERNDENEENNTAGNDGNASDRQLTSYKRWQEIADQTEVELRSHIATSETIQGTEKGNLLETLMGIKRDDLDYSDFLRKFAVMEERMLIDMDSFDFNFYTYGLELYKDMPLIEPLEFKEQYSISEFVIAIDTSGSCDLELIKKFITVTYNILFESVIDDKRMEVHIVQCDAAIQEDYVIRSREDVDEYVRDLTIKGRGGTDFRPVFEYINEKRDKGALKELRGLIYFTDGYGIFPNRPTEYKTAFVFAEIDQNVSVPPWIMKTYIEKELLGK